MTSERGERRHLIRWIALVIGCLTPAASAAATDTAPVSPLGPDRLQQRAGLAVMGTGLVTIATGCVLGGIGIFDRARLGDPCPAAIEDCNAYYSRLWDDGRAFSNAATVLFALGAVSGIAGLHLYWTGGAAARSSAPPSPEVRLLPLQGGAAALFSMRF